MRRLVLVALAAYHLALGLFMIVAPRQFYEQFAGFGVYNDHYIRDNATLFVALGATLLIAVARAGWRLPLLVFASIQYATHALNHLWDVGDADPGWQGPFSAVAVAAIGVAIAWLAKGAWEEDRAQVRGSARVGD